MDFVLQRRYSRVTIWVVLLAALGIIGGWLLYTQPGVLGKADAVGYAICHRIPGRSFEAFGRPLPLCARCTGIYLGVMTGLGVYVASGRSRVTYLPHWRILLFLGLFVAMMGVDGVNSYFHLFPGFVGIYTPSNALRVATGIFCGLTLITIVFPIFHQSIWHHTHAEAAAPIRNMKELAGVSLLALLMLLLVLAQNATILLFLGILSAAGVLIVLTMIMTVAFVTVTDNFRTYRTWGELWLPLCAGLTLAIAMIFAINVGRYTLTGTWEGFVF